MKKILILDDDADWAKDTQEYLNKKGYIVTTESDPKKSLNLIEKEFFDALIIDYDLLDGIKEFETGLQVMKAIRTFDKIVPIILTSGRIEMMGDMGEMFKQAINLGVMDYFEKGLGAKKLLEMIQKNEIRRDDIYYTFIKKYLELKHKSKEKELVIISSDGKKYDTARIIKEIRRGTKFGMDIKEKLAEFSLEALN